MDEASSFPQPPVVNDNDRTLPSAERTGPAIVALLQQAAEAARRNEERARAQAVEFADEIRRLEQRNQALEAHAHALQQRATRAEEWLTHIYDEIRTRFMEAIPAEDETRRVRRG